MPRNKKKNEKPPPHPIEVASAAEQHNMMKDIIEKVMFHMKRQNESHKIVADLQKKIGKNSAVQMSKKEKDKAKVVYEEHLRNLVESQKFVTTHLNLMKQWRENAVDKARDACELNALELLKLRIGCRPIWDPIDQPDGFGAGAIDYPDDKRPEKGEEVAAWVDETKTWILAQVIGPISNHRYECIDVDDEGRKVAVFARKQIIVLPQYTVHYRYHPNMAYPPDAIVLALFPGTTCFYEGIVHRIPQRASDSYLIRFVDNQRPDKYSDPLAVPDRYVTGFKCDPIMYMRPSKRAELGLEPHKVEKKRLAIQKVKRKPVKKVDDSGVIDERDVPGPAPKAPPTDYNDLTNYMMPTEKAKKSADKKRSKSDKPKIIRARVPAHKKNLSTRMFGKRRIKRKPKITVPTSSQAGEPGPSEKKDEVTKTEKDRKTKETREELSDSDDELGDFGLEEESIETDDEEEARRRRAAQVQLKKSTEKKVDVRKEEEKKSIAKPELKEGEFDLSDEDATDREDNDEEKNEDVLKKDSDDDDDDDDDDEDDDEKESEDGEKDAENDLVEEEKEVQEPVKEKELVKPIIDKEEEQPIIEKSLIEQKDKIQVEKKEEKKDDTKEQEKEEEPKEEVQPHDPEEGTSSGPRPYDYDFDPYSDYGPIRNRSSSESSDAQSGISVSDHERNKKGHDSDDEDKK